MLFSNNNKTLGIDTHRLGIENINLQIRNGPVLHYTINFIVHVAADADDLRSFLTREQ
jgi:hypothetical protein